MGLPAGSCRAAGQGTPVTLMSQLAVCARGARSVCFLDATGEIFAERGVNPGQGCSDAFCQCEPSWDAAHTNGTASTHEVPLSYLNSALATRDKTIFMDDVASVGRAWRAWASRSAAPQLILVRGKIRASTERALLPDSCPAK